MRSINIRSVVFTALFAALFIVLSMQQMRLSFSAIPITLQTLAVIMAGLFLKPKQAFASVAVVIALAAFGLPLFGGKGGISHLLGPTGGFIAAFPFCAMLTSMAVDRWLAGAQAFRRKGWSLAALFLMFFGLSSMLSYIPGLLWMKHALPDYTWAKTLSVMTTFLPGDAVKSAFGAIVAVSMLSYVARFRASLSGSKHYAARNADDGGASRI